MTPLMPTWAFVATAVALLLALRGAWALALACFLLSPAPVWAYAQAPGGTARPSRWLRAVAMAAAVVVAAYIVALAAGGLPPMHEWRVALFGR
jgi:hypothetical protein